MIRILVYGAKGTMGKIITNEIESHPDFILSACVSKHIDGDESCSAFADLDSVNVEYDVVIDFSHFSLTDDLIDFCIKKNKPLVLATTGLSEEQEQKVLKASDTIPVFRSKNLSIGINLIAHLIQEAHELLNDFDIEIIEKHHNKKVDAPSGTAFLLADAINQKNDYTYIHGRFGKTSKRNAKEIGIHSVRGGTIVGEHSVIFAGTDEIVEFKHEAHSKKVFAKGALNAAKFLISKKNGLFNMNDLITRRLTID
ncbi:MAG: 4-hydroxy-tetrahydrodipicolinate reductase [Clostridiales bacterium]|nr:4-hydroxy-tetrahydrodipicolinate reductase [Clostridiales bacterium]